MKAAETGAVGGHLSTHQRQHTHSMILGELSLSGAWDFGEVRHDVVSLIPT